MKYKVILLIGLLVVVMLFSFSTGAVAKTETEDFLYENYDIKLSNDVTDVLELLGFEDFSAEEFSKISLSDTFRSIMNVFKGSINKPITALCSLLGLIVSCAVACTFMQNNKSFAEYFNSIITLLVALVAFVNAAYCISDSVAAVYSAGLLMKSLIPATAVLTALSGSPSMAVSYNAISMYCAEIISAICRDFLSPVLCSFSAVSMCLSVNIIYNSDALLEAVKKFISVALGLAGTIFTGILSLKDVLAVGIDKVAVKGAKFILGSSVPVVGSALSEGLSSVIASVSLMKNTYGTIGIIVIVAVTLPAICELILWQLTFSLTGYAAKALGLDGVSKALTSLKYVMSMMLSVLLFLIYVLIVSAAMVILLGNK